MASVLIPSNEKVFVKELSLAYVEQNFTVSTGLEKLFDLNLHFDFIHLQWPEEFFNWLAVKEDIFSSLKKVITHRKKLSQIIWTAHNPCPHIFKNDAAYYAVYQFFIENSDYFMLFSPESRIYLQTHYQKNIDINKVLWSDCVSYDRITAQNEMGSVAQLRTELGLKRDDFVILSPGAIRHRNEFNLIQQSFSAVKSKEKKLVLLFRHWPKGNFLRSKMDVYYWEKLIKQKNVYFPSGDLSTATIQRFMVAADAMIVARMGEEFNSATTSFALSYKKTLFLPEHFRSASLKSTNIAYFYTANSPDSLALALNNFVEHRGKKKMQLPDSEAIEKVNMRHVISTVKQRCLRTQKTVNL